VSSPAHTYVPKHVTFVSWQYPEVGGCGHATELLARGLRRQGVAVDFVSMIPGVRPTDFDTLSVFRMSDAHRGPVFREASGLVARVHGLGRLVAKRLDMARGQSVASRRLSKLGEDSVVVFTNVGPKKILSTAWRRSTPGPIVIGQHHSSYFGAHATGQLEDMRDHFDDIDAFVTLTEEDARQFQDVVPVPCSAIPNISQAPEYVGGGGPGRVAIALTRYAREKRLDVMIKAFGEATTAPGLHDWELHLYGSGDLREELQSLVDVLALTDRVRLHDRTNDVSRVLAGAAINLMSSQYEGFPMAVLEASAHGLPTIAFDCSAGMRELVSDRTGALLGQDDVPGFVNALRVLMLDDAERRARGVAARASVQKYHESNVVEQWLALLDDCVRRRATNGSR
jgi:glycosyltransferase involved in cell wall biosynthesis